MDKEQITETSLSPFRPVTRYVTGHSPDGKAIVHSTSQLPWLTMRHPVDDSIQGCLANQWTTSDTPVNLNGDADIVAYEEAKKGPAGLVLPGGTVSRVLDLPPDLDGIMHRTLSVDVGIVVEGTIEMELDSGQRITLERGDIIVQRATSHGWKNKSKTEWARIFFSITESQPVRVGGRTLGHDLGEYDSGRNAPQ